MGSPLSFSVGIPAFNQGEYLEETINSLLDQTRTPDEIFISDHYSTDNTPEIIEKYVQMGKVRAGKPPAGVNLTGQWEYTLANLRGDWVTLLSSDDVARPNFCSVLLRGATRRPDVAVVRAGWENIDQEGKVLSKQYMLSVPPVVVPPQTLLSQRHGPMVSFASYALNRQALIVSGPLFAEMESLADWAMFVQISPFGSFVYEDEIISGYRLDSSDKFRMRLGKWVRDEQRMFSSVLPLAAKRLGLTDTSWIAEANRKNFLRYLSSASKKLSAVERIERAPLFASWAKSVGCEDQLEKFKLGQTIASPESLMRRAKRFVRPMAQRLYAGLQRG